jgi:hypothetical protein
MRRWSLIGAAVALALLVWLPLGLAGLPLDTPDGFLHLGWSVAWVRQLQAGWLWPTWSDLPWAGAGSFALLIYPPLFRVISGLPMLIGVPPDHAIAAGLLLILLLNSIGAALLSMAWLRPGGWRWLLLISAALNPYLWVNIYVRGAWPEALAQALLWWLALGLVGLERGRRWGLAVSTAALTGVILSNWGCGGLGAGGAGSGAVAWPWGSPPPSGGQPCRPSAPCGRRYPRACSAQNFFLVAVEDPAPLPICCGCRGWRSRHCCCYAALAGDGVGGAAAAGCWPRGAWRWRWSAWR